MRPRSSTCSIYKPKLKEIFDKDLPDSVRKGQRITTMTSGQARFPVAPSVFKFQQHGKSGAWLSELLPHLGTIVDDLAIVKTLNTEAINHDPAITFIQTGSEIPGRPSMGAWLSYGIGSPNQRPAGLRRAALATGQPAANRRRCFRDCGAPASCRRSIRASRCARSATRCCTCRTRRA